MKWVLLAFLVGLALAVTLWPSPHLKPYEMLSDALGDSEKHVLELWSLASREDGAGWIARVELSRVLLARGEAPAAVGLLREALALRDSAEARKLLAQALEGSGRLGEALNEWKELLPDAEAAAAVLRLERDGLAAAQAFVAGRAYAQALTALSGLNSPEAALLRARALAGLGRPSEATREYATYLKSFPSDTQAQLEYGQVLERLGETEKALAAYRAAGPAGAYALGLLLEATGASAEALSAYLRSGDPEARWRAARLLEAQGHLSEAIALYRELAQSSMRVADDAALRLFLLLSREGRTAEAAAAKTLLGPAFLWILGDSPPSPSLGPDPFGPKPEVVALAEALVGRFGDRGRDWAYITLEIALGRASPSEALAIGEWYGRMGDWPRAYTVGARVLSAAPCPRAYRLAYPKAWEQSVLAWSRTYAVDPFLVWAVMREESGFLSTAVSTSGARGLMQLLPSTARWIAEEKLAIPYREELLFDPDYNIRLGTWYLRHLLDQFGGDMIRAVAAYNAGPGNLRRWAAEITDSRDLPGALRSTETREYLTKVLCSWLIYGWLYR